MMKKAIILIIMGLCLTQSSEAQTERAYLVAQLVQNTVLRDVSTPPAADQIRLRDLRADGTQVLDYKNGVRIVLHTDNTIEKFSPDRSVRQVFVFKNDMTHVFQYEKIGKRTYCITFEPNEEGGYVAVNAIEVSSKELTRQFD